MICCTKIKEVIYRDFYDALGLVECIIEWAQKFFAVLAKSRILNSFCKILNAAYNFSSFTDLWVVFKRRIWNSILISINDAICDIAYALQWLCDLRVIKIGACALKKIALIGLFTLFISTLVSTVKIGYHLIHKREKESLFILISYISYLAVVLFDIIAFFFLYEVAYPIILLSYTISCSTSLIGTFFKLS